MRILLLENDGAQLSAMEQLMRLHGLEADTAQSIREARERLSASEYGALIADYDLPDGFCTELLEDALVAPERVIVVTGRNRRELPRGPRVLVKPIPVDDLLDALGEIMGVDLRDPATSKSETELVLYVGGNAPSSVQARRNLAAVLVGLQPGVSLEIIDLAESPDRGDPDDRVIFTPTLVRRWPRPRAWLVGDLSDRATLLALITRK